MDENVLIKLYYDWLVDQIDYDYKAGNYEDLLEYLFNMDFVWLDTVPLDENRAIDGLELRENYAKIIGENDGNLLLNLLSRKRCSMLEMLVAFSERLTGLSNLNGDMFAREKFFWMFIDNLGLNWATKYDFDMDIVGEILNDFLSGTVHGREPKGNENPPVLFPCREVYNNMNYDLFMQANLYLKSYLL